MHTVLGRTCARLGTGPSSILGAKQTMHRVDGHGVLGVRPGPSTSFKIPGPWGIPQPCEQKVDLSYYETSRFLTMTAPPPGKMTTAARVVAARRLQRTQGRKSQPAPVVLVLATGGARVLWQDFWPGLENVHRVAGTYAENGGGTGYAMDVRPFADKTVVFCPSRCCGMITNSTAKSTHATFFQESGWCGSARFVMERLLVTDVCDGFVIF